ncbi:hypothetical protein ACFQY8_00030 [Alloscardovia venturai]|uniref:Uncharacterized protein n=1 Tax=Alloscardovia venturai TaxID=1769421 RepID=A0ABW2Y331_9BIFI
MYSQSYVFLGYVVAVIVLAIGIFSFLKDVILVQKLSKRQDVAPDFEWFMAGILMIEMFVVVAALGRTADDEKR